MSKTFSLYENYLVFLRKQGGASLHRRHFRTVKPDVYCGLRGRNVLARTPGNFDASMVPTQGVIPPDGFMRLPDLIGPSEETLRFLPKLTAFTEQLPDIPKQGDPLRAARVEETSQKIWNYVRSSYSQVFQAKAAQLDAIFNLATLGGTSPTSQYTNAIKNLPKVLARGKQRGFFDACQIRVQEKRDIDQQLPKIGITPEDAADIKNTLAELKSGLAYSAKTTQSKTYIETVSPKQKRFDKIAFDRWVRQRSKGLVGIVRLNISDVPLSYASTEIVDFESDPTNLVKRTALLDKLTALQTEAYQEFKANRNAFDIETFLEKY